MSIQITQNGNIYLDENNRKNLFCFKSDFVEHLKGHHIVVPEMEIFSEESLFFQKFPTIKKNSQKVNEFKTEGNSQLSLLLAEMFFICKCVPKDEKNVTILYIGAHPGDHINFLVDLFEGNGFKFDLYDSYPEKAMEKIGKKQYKSVDENFSNINRRMEQFTTATAQEYRKRREEKGENIYLISDIRNISYGKSSSSENNSKILDDDMYNQINWCKIIQPKYAMVKYRSKYPVESVTYHDELTDQNDNPDSRKLYYKYPKGVFLKLPFQKKTQTACYFICNEYELTKKYYHYDINLMFDYHHYHVRKNVIYDNPFIDNFGMNVGIFSTEIVKKVIDSKEYKNYMERTNSDKKEIEYEKFAFGCGWDHRAAVYIGILHAVYTSAKNEHLYGLPETWKNKIAKKIMLPFILMREHSSVLNINETMKDY